MAEEAVRRQQTGWRPQPLPEVVLEPGTVATSDALTADGPSLLAVPVAPGGPGDGPQPRAGTADAAARYRIDLGELAERLEVTGEAGTSVTVPLPRPVSASDAFPWSDLTPGIVFVGQGDGAPASLRRAGAALARAAAGSHQLVTSLVTEADPDGVRQAAEGFLLAAYRPVRSGRADGVGGADRDRPAPGAARDGAGTEEAAASDGAARLVLLTGDGDVPQETVAALEAARTSARATWLARDLTTTPSSTKNPPWMAERAVQLVEDAATRTTGRLAVEVLDERALAEQGFGGILAVGGGSATPPRLVTISYRPAGRAAGQHVVVVGKGITYDTGGLSIKPRESMVPMKTDMAGSAVALAAVLGAAELDLPVRVTALLPLAENAVGASSYRPGDVVRTYDGTTVEIANTDAEGRMVLADALGYAVAELAPDVLVDVATLTGAASLGLGKGHGALFTADDALARSLLAAGEDTGEALWRLPLAEDYRSALDSTVADLRHVPQDRHVGGGAITAALFLQAFVGGRRWAHLDIAGPARAASASHEVTKGATGFGARLLLRWLEGLG